MCLRLSWVWTACQRLLCSTPSSFYVTHVLTERHIGTPPSDQCGAPGKRLRLPLTMFIVRLFKMCFVHLNGPLWTPAVPFFLHLRLW